MKKLIKQLPLSVKLILVGLLPLLVLVILSFQVYQEKGEKIAMLNGYLQRTRQAAIISGTVADLQRERRYSFGYLLKKQWETQMLLQRARTDSALALLAQQNDNRLKGIENFTFLNELPEIRSQIDDGSIRPEEVLNYYTNTVFRLNTYNNVAAGNVIYLQSANADLAAQKLLQEMITYLGIMRANIYYALTTGNNAFASAASLSSIHKIFNSYQQEFLSKASQEAIKSYRKIADSSDLNPTLAYINAVVSTDVLLPTYNAEEWWRVSANALDNLQRLQHQLLDRAEREVTKAYDKEITRKNVTLLVLFVIIALVIFFISYIIKIISELMMELEDAAEILAKGGTDIELEVRTKDAVGSLAKSIYRIDKNNKQLTKAAEAIGSGNFDIPVQPRSNEDLLGHAILQMKNDLQQFRQANQQKLWVHQGMEKVSMALQGEKSLEQLASDALHALVLYIGAEVGVFYLADEYGLNYVAGYAVRNDAFIPKQVQPGETLVGEAALQKQILQLDVPEDFIKISSGTGSTIPRQVLVVPLYHNDIVEGVLEIGAIQPFEPEVKELLTQLQSSTALILRTAKNRVRLKELLEETQSQAEELQAQHSELENINTELEAQAQKLQVSEEELRVQQEELMEANQELEERTRLLEEKNQQIAQQNLDIQKKAEELAISTKYKSEFLANMSHELRTPLNSILLLSRLLSENIEKNLSADQVEYAKVIMSSGTGLLTLIDEILDLSKIESGKMELEFSDMPLQAVAADLKAVFTPMAKEKNIGFDIDIDPSLPATIETDRLRLEQILKNLISNALKFTGKGAVTLKISPLSGQDQFIAFSVIDSGIGIPQDKQKLIFEAFQQADGSTRRKYGGTGLGLSISRELVKLLGGEIKLESEPGKGSEFTVYIPRKKTAPSETPLATKTEEIFNYELIPADDVVEEHPVEREKYLANEIPENVPDDRKSIGPSDKSILIIEDDVAFAKSLLEFTRSKGYKGLVAVRGDEGIDLASRYKPVGILLDLQLPVKDGWEVMDELKNNKHTRHIPVHMMSSYEVKRESLYKGAVDFINKPVAYDQMQEVFRKIEKAVAEDRKKVLIVEENPMHARALAYFLETFNISSEVATKIKDGVDALKNTEVNCVIMDMGIPGQQGYEMLEAVKNEAGLDTLPIIIFTGKSLSKSEEMKIRQYADTIVVKTAHSYKRILDEVSLFLHLVEEGRKEKDKKSYRKLGGLQEVLDGKKILVVDDDVRNIFSLTRALESHRMQVVSAVDGKEALLQLEKDPDINAVLMDIMMPEMDGYETMKQIRKDRKYKKLPIIAVTAKAMTGDREKCIQAGASDYISKPVDVDQLLSLLRVWLYDKTM